MKPCKTDKVGKLRLEDQVCFALYSTSRAITKQYAILLDEMGITYPQYLTLLILWEQDGVLVRDIATALEVDGATATPLVQRLEKLGLVTRVRSTEDERFVHVFLTSVGKSYYKKALKIPHGLGCATGLNHDTAGKIVAEMNDIKQHILSQSAPSDVDA